MIFTRPTNGLGPVFERVEEHLKGQERLEREGIMVAAGPNWTDDEQYWEGEGMFVIRASSIEEARKIADDDIMHREGAREYRVRPWMINEGSLTFTLGMATGRFELK